MSGSIKVGGVTLATHSDATAKVSLDSELTFPAGHVVQVHQHNFADNDIYSGTTFHEITQATTSITTKKANSKILMLYSIAFGSVGDNMPVFQITWNGNYIPLGNVPNASWGRQGTGASGNMHYGNSQLNIYTFKYDYLVSPVQPENTNLEFKLLVSSRGTDTKEIRLNGPHIMFTWGDNNSNSARSSVTLMEISA